MRSQRTNRPFIQEVPRLLRERDQSIRALARTAGVTDSHLSRVLRGAASKRPSADLARRIALAFGLPEDYFPEFREAFVIQRMRDDAGERDRLYDRLRSG